MDEGNGRMMLVIFLILGAAGFCHAKAFPEGSRISRGKRAYDHGQYTGQDQSSYFPTYEDYWKQRGYYYPEIDGQPIYMPSVNQPEKIMNEYIDHYYRNKPTDVPVLQNADPYQYHYESKTDESRVFNNFGEASENHYGNYHVVPEANHDVTKYQNVDIYPKINYPLPEDKEYTPEIVDRVKVNGYENKASVQEEQNLKNMDEEYEEPVTYKLYEPDQAVKNQRNKHVPEISKVDDYDLPVVLETVKQKNKPKSTLSPSYDLKIHGIRKKTKGKRRKQSQALKYETSTIFDMSNEGIDHVLHFKGIDSLDEFHKDETDSQEYSFDKAKDSVTKKSEQKDIKTKDIVAKTESKEYKEAYISEKNEDVYDKTNEQVVKTNDYEHPVKTKEKAVVKTDLKEHPVKTKEKAVVKTDLKEHPVKTKEKEPENKIKDKVIMKEKTKEVKPESEEYLVDTKDEIENEYENDDYLKNTNENEGKLAVDLEVSEDESTNFKRSFPTSDFLDGENSSETLESESAEVDEYQSTSAKLDQEVEENDPFSGNVMNPDEIVEDESQMESTVNPENEHSENPTSINLQRFLPNDAVQKLSSLNSNIWSLVFNPNAQALNLKKCITRNNETGFCTYVQHCEVPNLVTSLEQLLNNACVIDDIFIGVCCPEFPVETVKVHWDQPSASSAKRTEDGFVHNAEDCGIRSTEASKRQSWPWKAPLVSMSNGKIFCGGVLINEEYVLTAAHCTTKIPKNQILVRLGQFDDSTGDDFAVVEIKRHAQYNPRTLHNDIALLKLGRRIIHDDHTGVICLPEDDIDEDDENDHSGEKATLLGWRGMFGTKSKDPESLEVMSNEECAKKLRMKVPDSLLCTSARNEDERTCNADSGAPLVIEDGGNYEVIGILSWNRNDCDQRFPSTFSRVSTYIGWIQKHLT